MDISVINSIQDQFNKNEATYLSSSLSHRKSALDFALLHNFPGRKDEEYKYTPINRILKKNFDFEKIVTSKTTALHFEDHFYKLKGNHLVFLNGNYLPARSELLNDVCCQSATDSDQSFKDVFDALNVAFCEDTLKIEVSETDKRIKEIAKSQNNFKDVSNDVKAVSDDLVIFDYKATIDEKAFTGGEGKNTQLILGKDLFIKGFDKHLIGVKKDDEKIVEATLPENYPQKEFANKKAKFLCKILNVRKSVDIEIDDEFAKNLGAKDLVDLKFLVSKQINDEYKNSLDRLAKNQILKEIENFKVEEIPENLVEEEVKILSQGMSEEDSKKSKKNFEEIAKKRIKVGLILNEFGEQNKIKVSEQEVQAEVQKQLRTMPGQEKMVMEFYQKNPQALASLRGTVYEEKIINSIKNKAKPNKKEISKDEAEKILKKHQKQDHNHEPEHNSEEKKVKEKKDLTMLKKDKPKKKQTKKVSKKESQVV